MYVVRIHDNEQKQSARACAKSHQKYGGRLRAMDAILERAMT